MKRLQSLDLMRGSVMLFLTVIQPLCFAWANYCEAAGSPCSEGFYNALTHATWEGWSLWDLIMPAFIFMCGVAIPFATTKYLDNQGHATWGFYRHLLWRVASLWFLGMLIQGNLLSLQWSQFYFFTNTLQAIAVGYGTTMLASRLPWRAIKIALPFALMALYGLLLEDYGAYTPTNNLAYEVEQALLPGCQDDPKYTWILTSLMFSAMTMLGALCGQWLKEERPWEWKALFLGVAGLVLFLIGEALATFIPIIKPIYTVSFTAIAIGLSTLILAGIYTVVDGFKRVYGFGLVTLFGQFALVAYMLYNLCFYRLFLPFGQFLSQGVYNYYISQADPAMIEKAAHAHRFMANVIALHLFIFVVYLWGSRQRALRALKHARKEA